MTNKDKKKKTTIIFCIPLNILSYEADIKAKHVKCINISHMFHILVRMYVWIFYHVSIEFDTRSFNSSLTVIPWKNKTTFLPKPGGNGPCGLGLIFFKVPE